MTAVGFEPTPLRTGAWSQRLRPLGQTVMTYRHDSLAVCVQISVPPRLPSLSPRRAAPVILPPAPFLIASCSQFPLVWRAPLGAAACDFRMLCS